MTARKTLDQIAAPPGVCEDCLRNNIAVLYERVVLVHCRHTMTGAWGYWGESVFWTAYRPISRERFEQIATETARDVVEASKG